MQRRRRALRAKERLPRSEALPRTTRPNNARARLPEHASGLFHTGKHAVFAREVLDFPQLFPDAENFGREVDVGHVLQNELVDAAIGNEHVHKDPFHSLLRRASSNPLIRLSRRSERSGEWVKSPNPRPASSLTPSLGFAVHTFNLAFRWEIPRKRRNLKNTAT